MTNERAKRFPLGLEDLVREPRRPEGRPGEVRAANLAAAADSRAKSQARQNSPARPSESAGARTAPRQPAKKPVMSAQSAVKTAAANPAVAGAKSAAKTAANVVAKVPARSTASSSATAAAKPALKPAAKPALQPAAATVVNKPLTSASGHANNQPVSQTLVRQAAALANRPALTPVPAWSGIKPVERSAAPNLPLNGAQALTSERVRERMVERLRANGITDQRVIHAMSVVPRHMFVDPGLATQAYEDAALPIGHHQTISKPSVVARMIELAAVGRPLANVLEIGTGCGYQAAVLSQVARDVYSIERIKPLYERAKTNLRPLRIPNIRLHYGDGRIGLPAVAPFDAIVIAAAGLDVPQALLEQLAIGGRLVAPVGTQDGQTQVLTLVERIGPAQWRESRLDRVFFVPLKSGVI
jgi:protein-L-isoaspartate(D-aspartate) O-methyltransferase